MNTVHRGWTDSGMRRIAILSLFTLSALVLSAGYAFAHAVTEVTRATSRNLGVNIIPSCISCQTHGDGYDHILFLLGVVFFLYKMKDVGIYVSLFAIGHSTTMLAGVWFGWGINAYIIDAIIGLSVVYKALDNLGPTRDGSDISPTPRPRR